MRTRVPWSKPGAAGTTLRRDLFYRLGVLRIDVPPLRERPEDIPALVQAFLRDAPPPRRAISQAALDQLMAYAWPGNVRLLRTRGNRAEAARLLGIRRALLYDRIRHFGIETAASADEK